MVDKLLKLTFFRHLARESISRMCMWYATPDVSSEYRTLADRSSSLC